MISIKEKIKNKELIIGGQVFEIRSPVISEIYAMAGFDYLLLDLEHSSFTISEAAAIIRSANYCNIPALVRIPQISYGHINPLLDQGANGIIVPRVINSEQVKEVLGIMKYYPQGKRGWGPSDFCLGKKGIKPEEFINSSNNELMLVIQIESEEAINNIDDIISCSGIDVILIGANDLSLTLGEPCNTDSKKFSELMKKVISKCCEKNICTGMAGASIANYKKWIYRGVKFIWIQNEMKMILEQSISDIKELRKGYFR